MTDPAIHSWRRVEALVDQALRLPTASRQRFVDRQAVDSASRRWANRLLDADRDAGDFLDRPASSLSASLASVARSVPEQVGPYTIVRPIHQGGMGAVFLARRDDGEFRRDVAIKVLHVHVVCDETLARLKAERQILADLAHPNIARLYDGGTLPDGRPFLVLELVEGLQIDLYCARRRCSIDERFALVEQLAAALTHCHARGLVHRDVKPSNVLVTPAGVVKLIDFGIAKHLPVDAGLTRTGHQPRTPGYASPEQILGRPVGRATDVHALGSLLFELVTGSRLYASTDASLHEIERAICERSPEPPSVATCRRRAAHLGAPPASLRPPGQKAMIVGTLRRRFDRPILRALSKAPEHRQPSVEALIAECRDDSPARHRGAGARLAFLVLALLGVDGVPRAEMPPDDPVPVVARQLHLDEVIDPRRSGPPAVRDAKLPEWPSLTTYSPTMAVLLLRSAADDQIDLRSAGLGHEIVEHLAQWPELRPMGHRSTWRIKTGKVDYREALAEHPDMAVFVGRVSHSETSLSLDLSWARKAVEDRAGSWSVPPAEACHLARRVAETIARISGVDPGLPPVERACVPGAYDRTLRARALVALYGSRELPEAIELLEEAVALDPGSASAWTALAQARVMAWWRADIPFGDGFRATCRVADRAASMRPAPWLDLVRRLCLARLQGRCDPLSPSASFTLPAATVPILLPFVDSVPGLGPSTALAHRAAAQDPYSSFALLAFAEHAWRAGDLDLASLAVERATLVDPRTGGGLVAAQVALARGELARAQAANDHETNPELFALLGQALLEHAAGRPETARQRVDAMIERFADVGAYQVAQALAVLGEVDAAFEWLERARGQRDPGMIGLAVDPHLDGLHDDPRWADVLPDPHCPRLPFE